MSPKEFKALQKLWYDRLKEVGFVDIEDPTSPREVLIDWDSFRFKRRYDPATFQATETYYSRAMDLLNEQVFERELDKDIWILHAGGMPERKISEALAQPRLPFVGAPIGAIALSRPGIQYVLQKYKRHIKHG